MVVLVVLAVMPLRLLLLLPLRANPSLASSLVYYRAGQSFPSIPVPSLRFPSPASL